MSTPLTKIADTTKLAVNTKVMIRSNFEHRQAFNGQIGTITNSYSHFLDSNGVMVFEVTLNKEYLGQEIVDMNDLELIAIDDLEQPISPVTPEKMKNLIAEAKERAGA
tara:strand:+ start:214 stop:537 length:324 start_codon:yes stop_codon:yes gene_type:complete